MKDLGPVDLSHDAGSGGDIAQASQIKRVVRAEEENRHLILSGFIETVIHLKDRIYPGLAVVVVPLVEVDRHVPENTEGMVLVVADPGELVDLVGVAHEAHVVALESRRAPGQTRLEVQLALGLEGVAGVDYEIPREKADELPRLTDEELTDLVDSRINTVRDFDVFRH